MTTALRTGLRRVAARLAPDDTPDGELLARFLAHRDEAAFAAVVHRHAAMVFGTCRRVLGNAADADDAFQAAFVVLVRRAAGFTGRACVGNFLYGVAYHTALKAKAMAANRRLREAKAEPPPAPPDDSDLLRALDEELAKLPEKYREPVVLCELEGHTRRAVAERLNVAEGTLSSRLATAHRMLEKRLKARGFAVAGVAALLATQSPAASPALAAAAVQAAVAGPTGGVPQLVAEVSKMVFLSKLKLGAAVLVGVAVLAAVAHFSGLWNETPASAEVPTPKQEREPLAEVKGPVPQKPPEDRKAAVERAEADLLRGTWVSTTVLSSLTGLLAPVDRSYTWTFDGTDATCEAFAGGKLQPTFKGRLVLNPNAYPKEMNVIGDRALMLCVYETGDDYMRIAMYDRAESARPKGFHPADAGMLSIIELQKKIEIVKVDPAVWRKEFNDAYALKEKETLKRVPPPLPAARDHYLDSINYHPARWRRKTSSLVFQPRSGQPEMWGSSGGSTQGKHPSTRLYSVLTWIGGCANISSTEVECPTELGEHRFIPGDWVIRDGAKADDFVAALDKIVRDELKWPVRVKTEQLERDVIVVKGRFASRPLPDRKPNHVDLYAADRLPKPYSFEGTFDEFLRATGVHVGMRVVSEVGSPPQGRMTWCTYLSGAPPFSTVDPNRVLDGVLARVTEQTGLTFEKAKRKVRVISVTEEK